MVCSILYKLEGIRTSAKRERKRGPFEEVFREKISKTLGGYSSLNLKRDGVFPHLRLFKI